MLDDTIVKDQERWGRWCAGELVLSVVLGRYQYNIADDTSNAAAETAF